MYGFRKSDDAQFICGSEDVCRIADGSTNEFLTEPRILEEFLRGVEPFYDRACTAIAEGNFDIDDIVIIAGFVAFVIGTSPTAMRLGAESLSRLARTEVELLDRNGILDRAPAELGGKSATELLGEGGLRIDTDVKFPQAMGISGIVGLTKSFATFHWEILVNTQSDRFPFVTSDYPAAIEGLGKQIPANRVVPLRPNLAVRILPQIRPEGSLENASDFRFKFHRVSPSEVRKINVAIARSAENIVFAPTNEPWVKKLVAKNRNYHLELEHAREAKGSGFLLLNSIVVQEKALGQR